MKTIEEVNKNIINFMQEIDWSDYSGDMHIYGKTCRWYQEDGSYWNTPCYTKTLDPQTAVWKNLNKVINGGIAVDIDYFGSGTVDIDTANDCYEGKGETIYEASARAIDKIIDWYNITK